MVWKEAHVGSTAALGCADRFSQPRAAVLHGMRPIAGRLHGGNDVVDVYAVAGDNRTAARQIDLHGRHAVAAAQSLADRLGAVAARHAVNRQV